MAPTDDKKQAPVTLKNVVVFVWQKIPKTFFWTVISTVLIGTLSVSYAFVKTTSNVNKTVPAYQAQTTQIQSAVTSLTLGQAAMQRDIDNTDKNFTKLQESVDKAFDKLNDRLDRLFDKTEQINRQTK